VSWPPAKSGIVERRCRPPRPARCPDRRTSSRRRRARSIGAGPPRPLGGEVPIAGGVTHAGVVPAISQIRLMAEIMSRRRVPESGLVDETQHVRQGADGLVFVHGGSPGVPSARWCQRVAWRPSARLRLLLMRGFPWRSTVGRSAATLL
jgi:hypothetical protein